MRLTFIFLIFSVLIFGQSNVLAKDQDSEETTSNNDSSTTTISAPASSDNTIAATVNDLDIFERKIEMYARIVQTYGLAVFLVLWYVFVVWKKQNQDREEDRKERAKWIEQITGLRLLVDPAVKKLTRQQARTILQMAIAGQVDRLTLVAGQFEISYRGGMPSRPPGLGGGGLGDSQEKAIYVFNTEIRLIASDSSAIEASLEKANEAINEIVRRTEKESKDMFRWLDQYHQRITLRLDSLQFGDTTLGKIFSSADTEAREALNESLKSKLPDRYQWDLREAKRFLLEHAVDPDIRAKINDYFESIPIASFQEALTSFQNIFEQSAEAKLVSTDWMAS